MRAARHTRVYVIMGLLQDPIDVADPLAQGMSDKDGAAKLVVSQRTAEAHVEHILTKLGFHSRAQIATWVTAQQEVTRQR